MNKLLSLCMIVKDEEKTLRRCLDSVKGLVDEIIVVDTGSTDKTVEIASEFTDHVYLFQWINDFAAAKNEAISKSTAKWILVLDADEYVQPDEHQHLREHLQNLDHMAPQGIVLPIFNFLGHVKDRRFLESTAVRLFTNHPDVYFFRPIHEQITYRHGEIHLTNYHFKIFHTGYTDETRSRKDKSTRNLSIFESLSNKTDYDFFTLGNEYMILNDYKKALYYYERAYKKAKKNEVWYLHCVNSMINAYFYLDKYKEASELIEESIQNWPHFSDYYCYRGLVYSHFGLYNHAIKSFNQAIEIGEKPASKNQRFWLISPIYGSSLPYSKLSNIYSLLHDMPNAVYCLTKLMQLMPDDRLVLYQLLMILVSTESTSSIVDFLKKIYPEMTAANALLLFQMGLLVGKKEITDHYYKECIQFGIEISSFNLVQYALIINNQSLFDQHMAKIGHSDEHEETDLSKTLFLAACLWKDLSYLNCVSSNKEMSLTKTTIEHILSGSLTKDDDIDLLIIIKLLIDLFKMGHFEVYDWLIKQLPSHQDSIANLLGDYFYTQNQIELAFDYYSMLLQKNTLQATGYENIARLYLQQGEVIEGLEFLRTALTLNPNNIVSYTLFLQHCSDAQEKAKYKELMYNQFPQYRGLPFIKSL
ncbi:glycosyltransferase [Paenibacillus ehimensis]|uniref:glycosyltransferase n=1 Tax=Paenibacillus ehimensis TaxID=79264 RepID=UPI003D2D99CD